MARKLNVAEMEYIKNHKELSIDELSQLLDCTTALIKKIRVEQEVTNDNGEFHPKNVSNPGFGKRSGAIVLTEGMSQKMDDFKNSSYSKRSGQ